jgi:hypothetical protein
MVNHQQLPLHRILAWNGHHFERADLGNLGLVLHLGHQGSPCSLPGVSAVHDWEDTDFSDTPDETLNIGDEHGIVKVTIVDSAGVFQRRFHFCKCPTAASCWEQLLQGGFWPASLRRPQTAFTLNVLHQFHYASLEAKVAASAF